jgi:hypothetical protein
VGPRGEPGGGGGSLCGPISSAEILEAANQHLVAA